MTGGRAAAAVAHAPAVGEARRAAATAWVCAAGAVTLGFWGVANMIVGDRVVGVQNLLAALAWAGGFALNRAGRREAAATLANALFLGQMLFSIWLFGHASGAWLFFLPGAMVPLLIFGPAARGRAAAFAAASAVGLVASVVLQDALPPRRLVVSAEFMQAANAALALLATLAIAAAFVRAAERAEGAFADARRRAESLLHAILPESVADRLQSAPGEPVADRHEDVAVMFADLAGFTEAAAGRAPEEVVAMLDTLFAGFDDACAAAGVEKLRTVGDGYIAVCGAPLPAEDPAGRIVAAGLAILEVAARHGLSVRVGAHRGPLVAGVVGTRRFQYDIWGDTVNTAARMESTGVVGRVQLSEAMAQALEGRVPLVARGEIEVKGKGRMRTFLVEPGARVSPPARP